MMDARTFLADPRFHKTFTFQRAAAGPFRIKYADYGYRDEANPGQENVLLFFGPLFASRLIHIAKDNLAKRHRVRFINPDRPGIGGTDPSLAGERMALWRDAICALLRHLDIRHVFVVCHSGGIIYALDFILHYPEVLDPNRPYLAVGAPWILPKHTGSALLGLAHALPACVIGQADKLAAGINNYVGPAVGFSVGLSFATVVKLSPAANSQPTRADESDGDFEQRLWPAIVDLVYDEGVSGMGDEAVLLMQKCEHGLGWGVWNDFDDYIPKLQNVLQFIRRKVDVEVFYAEKDWLIGDEGSKGQLWFERCWSERLRGQEIRYHSQVIKNTDHNGIWNLRTGAMQQVFERINPCVQT